MLLFWELGKRIFSVLVDVQHYFGNSLPPQVKVLEPVCLEDALGRTAPFHVEWVNSREVSFYQSILDASCSGFQKLTIVPRCSKFRWKLAFEIVLDGVVLSAKNIRFVISTRIQMLICITHG